MFTKYSRLAHPTSPICGTSKLINKQDSTVWLQPGPHQSYMTDFSLYFPLPEQERRVIRFGSLLDHQECPNKLRSLKRTNKYLRIVNDLRGKTKIFVC